MAGRAKDRSYMLQVFALCLALLAASLQGCGGCDTTKATECVSTWEQYVVDNQADIIDGAVTRPCAALKDMVNCIKENSCCGDSEISQSMNAGIDAISKNGGCTGDNALPTCDSDA
ncbi:unnamed protein product [Symbiodinium natans]|uniref:Uncharacterized protein n=1 Tax=Symbiodinium natans TaxID=878477 RepID=A0A812P565_9DINO|nr:unnamed protein product [Symbiodinium natans]